jgi:hypothetical protein
VIDDEELELEVSRSSGPSPRRRWPMLALLGGAVVLVLLVSRIGEGSESTSLPRTTTTVRPTTTRQPTTTAPATTTSLPRFEAGTGPLLPAAGGTHIVSMNGDGVITVTDLGTGDRCATRAGEGSWPMSIVNNLRGSAPLQTPDGAYLVGPRCELTEIAGQGSYVVATSESSAWFIDGPWLVEGSLTGVRGRSIDLPQGASPSVVVSGDDVVVGLNGSMTLIDANGDRRDVGAGSPIAMRDRLLAFITCPALRCSLVLLDLDTGARRTIDDAAGADGFGVAGFSPDGRYVATTGSRGAAVIDVTTGSKTVLDNASAVIGFTIDSDWVLVAGAVGRVIAIPLHGDAETVDLKIPTSTSDGDFATMVLLASPDY